MSDEEYFSSDSEVYIANNYSDHSSSDDSDEEKPLPKSPGIRILEAVTRLIPRSYPLVISKTAIALVEDLELKFPSLQIEMGTAVFNGVEVFIPIICDLEIFNANGLSPCSGVYKKISEASILDSKIRDNDWYIDLIAELEDAVSEYVDSFPLTISNTKKKHKVFSNFDFKIPPDGSYELVTNYRFPRYSSKTEVIFESKNLTVKKNKITAQGNETDILVDDYVKSYPKRNPSKLQTINIDNSNIVEWVESIPYELTDYCYEGLFTVPLWEERVKFVIDNPTKNVITVSRGQLLGELSVAYEKKN